MKIKRSIFVLLLLIFLLASCKTHLSSNLINDKIEDLHFGNEFSNPKIVRLKMNIYHSKIFSFDGELYDKGQVYAFSKGEKEINFFKINDIDLNDSDYYSLDKIISTLSNINLFMQNKFSLSSFNIRFFSNGHNISIKDKDFPIYDYFNKGFYLNENVSQINAPCFLVNGEDKAMIIILND